MTINKDLTDAVLMISFISLVLVGTSDFENVAIKTPLMIILGIMVVAMVGLRIYSFKDSTGGDHAH